MRAAFLLLSALLAWPATAQTGAASLQDRIASVERGTDGQAECDAQVARATALNAPDLLYGAWVCFAADKGVEGSYLLNAGQVRSLADMALMVPASKVDSDVVSSLYGFIYFQAGGPGMVEVFRGPPLRERFFGLYDNWSPSYSSDYDPGWSVRRRPDTAAYQAAIREAKAGRRQQLEDVGRLYADDAYYALHRRYESLQARNPNGFVKGTRDERRSRELMRRMDERSTALGMPMFPAPEESGDPSSARFPPAAPTREEVVIDGSGDPVARRCADLAERMTIAAESRLARVLTTRSPDWGTIWRADLESADQGIERFTCTANSSSSRPLEMGDESVPPLPEGGL